MVELKLETMPRKDRLFDRDPSLGWEQEALWRRCLALIGTNSLLPMRKDSITWGHAMLQLWIRLREDRRLRAELAELYDLQRMIELTNHISVSLGGQSVPPSHIEAMQTLLWTVQSKTTPWAIAPQSEESDKLQKEMQAFEKTYAGRSLRITSG